MKKHILKSKMLKFTLPAALSLAAVFTFTACGSDSDSSGTKPSETEELAEVNTFDELPHCGKLRRGNIVYVAETDSLYECTTDGWVAVDSADVLSSSSNSGKSSSSYADEEPVKMDSITVEGFAQAGPYSQGSMITVRGLDEKFQETKEKFTGKTTDKLGSFSVSKITLEAPYLQVTASGAFTSPVTGKSTSGSKLSLSAVAVANGDDTADVNVNILTELEQAYALALAEKGEKLASAKDQATGRLFEIFGGDALRAIAEEEGFSATKISLADTNKAGVLLYAATVAILADLSNARVTRRLSAIKTALAEDGTFPDSILVNMADYIVETDADDGFVNIRKNLTAMNLASKVPDFESLLRRFVGRAYGFEECSDKNEEKIVKNMNKLSDYIEDGFACTNGNWHRVSALDTELGLCTSGRDGDTARTAEKFLYRCQDGTWLIANDVEQELGYCTEKRNGETERTENSTLYRCESGSWVKGGDLEQELGFCENDREGEAVRSSDETLYRCESESWVKAGNLEQIFGYCTSTQEGEFKSAKIEEQEKLYTCQNGAWVDAVIVDARDNKTYKPTKIGDQIWMAENLNYADSTTTASLKGKSWCYENSADSCAKYGRLYTWAAAIDSVALSKSGLTCGYDKSCTLPTKVKGICPEGFHLPDTSEWRTLINFIVKDQGLADTTTVGTYLKSTTGWNSYEGIPTGKDTYDFSALPAGYRTYYGYFDDAGNYASFWSVTESEDDNSYAYRRSLNYYDENFVSNSSLKNYARSIRCVKDSN